MAVDMAVDLIVATVQLEQAVGGGARTVGTGFLIDAPRPDGAPRTVLVTAGHVFERMPFAQVQVGYRVQGDGGAWRYDPQAMRIRGADERPLWTRHPTRDIAAIEVKAPKAFAQAAIPLSWLAKDETFDALGLGPGDEMMALGFPRGLAANPAGFPILRSGRVASYPLGPASAFPTFLLDFSVFPGNSGGPVFIAKAADQGAEARIAGMLTQQVQLNEERLEIGIVTHAKYVREAVMMLDGVRPKTDATVVAGPAVSAAVATEAASAAVRE